MKNNLIILTRGTIELKISYNQAQCYVVNCQLTEGLGTLHKTDLLLKPYHEYVFDTTLLLILPPLLLGRSDQDSLFNEQCLIARSKNQKSSQCAGIRVKAHLSCVRKKNRKVQSHPVTSIYARQIL